MMLFPPLKWISQVTHRQAGLCGVTLTLMSYLSTISAILLSAVVSGAWASHSAPRSGVAWRGVHLGAGSQAELDAVTKSIPALATSGCNAIVLEVDYAYQFKSRPEMASPTGITFAGARNFSKVCRQNHVRVIPQMNCLGHQSWAETTDRLLTVHPELDETPGLYPKNAGIYCRSWCPLHPDLYKIIDPMIDELIDAFRADAFHVGMDEVFILGTDSCPRCHGKTTASLFAQQVNTLHDHFKQKHVQMLMWGDRFLDGKATGYGEWEGATNGTDKAIDLVSKDIVMCDWHYEKSAYPSLQIFADHGFQVWPSTWRNADAAKAFSTQAKNSQNPKVMGVLVTTWGEVKPDKLPTWPPYLAALAPWL